MYARSALETAIDVANLTINPCLSRAQSLTLVEDVMDAEEERIAEEKIDGGYDEAKNAQEDGE